jgi:hypothetical protein
MLYTGYSASRRAGAGRAPAFLSRQAARACAKAAIFGNSGRKKHGPQNNRPAPTGEIVDLPSSKRGLCTGKFPTGTLLEAVYNWEELKSLKTAA